MRHQPLRSWTVGLVSAQVLLLAPACGSGSAGGPTGSSATTSAPAITAGPADATVRLGQPASFAVTATGTPPLSHQWRRDGVDLPGATSASWTLAAAARTDQGARFSVRVGNGAGQAVSTDATLTVQWAPAWTTDLPAALTVAAGQPVSLAVVVDASPAATLQWQRDGVDLPGAAAAAYTFTAAAGDDRARFSVRASNPLGSVTSTLCTLSIGTSEIPLTLRPHMDAATQAVYDRIRARPGWLLGVDALGTAANPFLTVPTAQVPARWTELYGAAADQPACLEWEMAERNRPAASRDWTGLKAFAQGGGLPWVMVSMNNFTVPYGPGTPPQGGMNDTRNHAAGVLPGGSGHAAFTAYIRQLAQEVKAAGVPLVLRPLHEGNGGWFWWGGTATDFKSLWQLVFQLFQEEGARNVIWLWAVGDVCGGGTCNAAAFYPGDAVVDMLGVDLYFNGATLPANGLNTLTALQALGPDKPIVIAELGPQARADFWQQAAAAFAGIPRFRGFSLWFARGWKAWGGDPAAGSLVDASSDAGTRAAFQGFLADPRVLNLTGWKAP